MKQILLAACILTIAANSFGQNNDAAYSLPKSYSAYIGTMRPLAQRVTLPGNSVIAFNQTIAPNGNAAAGVTHLVTPRKNTTYSFKKQWPVYACFFGAGLAYGTAEGLIWHTNNANNAFWNPYKSWRTGQMVDGYHAARAAGIGFFMAAAVLSVNDVKHPFSWGMLKKVAISSLAYWSGQMITWHTVK